VAANRKLRETLESKAKEAGFEFLVPEFKLCTDNAAMVAIAAYYLSQKKKVKIDDYKKATADPNWELA
jgi:N6-L-threonylcarbamoyladenine synthase